VKVGPAPGTRHRLGVGLWKAPGTTRGKTIETMAFVLPLSIAHVAVVRMELANEHLAPAAAHRTLRRADERQIA